MSDTTSTSGIGSQPGEQELAAPIPLEYPPSSDEGSTPPSSPSLEPMKQSSAEESTGAAKKTATDTYQPRSATSPIIVGTIVRCLQEVHLQMRCLREYIEDQSNSGKPLHQWQKYSSYWELSEAVLELRNATFEFKSTPLYSRDFIAVLIARTTLCSTSVSQAAVDILSAINKKTLDYMEEMEASSLSDEAKVEANAVITQETRKLLDYSTRAAEHVWRATDMLRMCKQKREDRDWLWSTTATAMHVFVAAAVGIFTVSLFSPAMSVGSNAVSSQMLDVVQQTQAISNLTGEIYNVKLQDIDQRVNDLGALSEANGLRIDNLVEGLGVPNEHGVWYWSQPQPSSNDKLCETRLQDVSDTLGRQLERQQQELEMLRKNMNRMDIRLTQDVKKLEKK